MSLGLASTAGEGVIQVRNTGRWAQWGLSVTEADGRVIWECYSLERYALAQHCSQSLCTHLERLFYPKMQVLKEKCWSGDFSEAPLEDMDLTSGQQCRVQVKRALRLGVQVQGSLTPQLHSTDTRLSTCPFPLSEMR